MKHSFRKRMAYRFDNYMAQGPRSIFLALLIVFAAGFIVIAVARIVASPFIADDVDANLGIWRIFLQLTDPGNMAQDNDSAWYVKIFAIASGMFGIVFFSAVIAFITTQLDIKLEDLKKGRSAVVERDHMLILGWNSQIVEIIRELIVANESERDAAIVVMSDQPKEEMDDLLNEQVPDRKTTRIITRTGSTGSLQALARVAAQTAQSVIILPTAEGGAQEQELAQSDAHTLKTTLAVIASCEHEAPQIVAQVYRRSNRQILASLSADKITIVDPEDMVAKIAVQTSRSTGLSAVYTGLIGFEGCEFYFTSAPWNGALFRDIHYHYPDGVAIGIRDGNDAILINPDPGYVLGPTDELIILAEDDSTIRFRSKPQYKPGSFTFHNRRIGKGAENILVIGWNSKGATIVEQYEDYIAEGSEIHLLPIERGAEIEREIEAVRGRTQTPTTVLSADPFDIEALKRIRPETYNSIVMLTSTSLDQERADANTINILLLLREVIGQATQPDQTRPQIITEVVDSENLELIAATGANDAIISTKMISKVLAQVAAEPDILKVYDEVFKEDGSEIYLKPLDLYLPSAPATLTFADLIHIAQSRNEICLGYRSKDSATDAAENFGIVLNPPKDQTVATSDIERIIVIAEDEL